MASLLVLEDRLFEHPCPLFHIRVLITGSIFQNIFWIHCEKYHTSCYGHAVSSKLNFWFSVIKFHFIFSIIRRMKWILAKFSQLFSRPTSQWGAWYSPQIFETYQNTRDKGQWNELDWSLSFAGNSNTGPQSFQILNIQNKYHDPFHIPAVPINAFHQISFHRLLLR